MAKFLIVVPPFFGHLSPTLSVGAGLLQKGHEVVWTGVIPVEEKHFPAGGRYVYPEKSLGEYREEINIILKRQDDGPSVSGPEVMKLALEETYIPIAKIMMKGLQQIVEDFQPDVIVNDCIAFGGALIAKINNIPCITTTPVPPDVMGNTAENAPKIFAWQQNLIQSLQETVGIKEEGVFIHSNKMNIVFTSQKFAAIENPDPHLKFVGPVEGRPNPANFDWNWLDNRKTPKIYVSLGTLLIDIRKEFFGKLIDELKDEQVTVVCATDPTIFEVWPDNFFAQSFVPQSALIKKMDMVICHGGFNTVNDTFINGLPMLITPIAYDHFHTASLILKAGCGLKIRYKRMRQGELKKAVNELLHNPIYKDNAIKIRTTFLEAGGTQKAIEIMHDFAIHETQKALA